MSLLQEIKQLQPNKEEWLLVTEAEEQLKEVLSKNTLRNLIARSKVETRKWNSRVYISIKSLKEYLSN